MSACFLNAGHEVTPNSSSCFFFPFLKGRGGVFSVRPVMFCLSFFTRPLLSLILLCTPIRTELNSVLAYHLSFNRYAAQRKSRHDEAASAAANAITIAPHDHKMYAVRATAAYKRRDWSAVVVEASACAKGLAAAQPSLLLKLAKGHGPSGVLRAKVNDEHEKRTLIHLLFRVNLFFFFFFT